MATKISALKNINEEEIKSALIPTAVNGDNRKLKISEYFASLDSFNNLKADFEKLVKEVEELGVAIDKIDTNLGDANDNLSNLEITLLTKIILPKPNKVVITTNSKTLTTSELDATKLNYLSDVTDNIQAQLNGKSNLGHTHLPSEINELEEKLSRAWGLPDYSSLVENPEDEEGTKIYTAPSNGFFRAWNERMETNASIKIFLKKEDSSNDALAVYDAYMSVADYINGQVLLPVAKGNVIKWYGRKGTFIPCK